MAAQSKISHRQHFAQPEQGFDQTSASPTIPMASIALYSAADLTLADPFASNTTIPISHEGQSNMHSDNYYDEEPCDGGSTVWYCSNCGDGPIGSWNPCCNNCGHNYCGACTVEKAA